MIAITKAVEVGGGSKSEIAKSFILFAKSSDAVYHHDSAINCGCGLNKISNVFHRFDYFILLL